MIDVGETILWSSIGEISRPVVVTTTTDIDLEITHQGTRFKADDVAIWFVVAKECTCVSKWHSTIRRVHLTQPICRCGDNPPKPFPSCSSNCAMVFSV
jgi:hypothetical protein